MAILDRDRKLLWGRSGNVCAICKRNLVEDRTSVDREAIVGEEAHIVAQSPGGPRFRLLEPGIVDSYENLILLCRDHHRVVDEQPNTYPEDRLHQIKTEHESWVKKQLAGRSSPPPVRLVADGKPGTELQLIESGADAWRVLDGAMASRRYTLQESDGVSADDCDAADEFLDVVDDYGMVADDIGQTGMRAIRDAQRELGKYLADLKTHDIVVYGGRRRLLLTGGIGEPTRWWESIFLVRRIADETPADRLIVGFVSSGMFVFPVPRQDASPPDGGSAS